MSSNDYAQARKEYVKAARRSFGQQEPDDYGGEPVSDVSAFFKVRLLAAVCIFAAFVLCDRTGSRFYSYTTDEIVSMIQKEQFQPQLESIREAWNAITNQQAERMP